jgi:hypothetical protein
MEGNLNLTLKIWRQKNAQTAGKFESYQVSGISTDMSFLEMARSPLLLTMIAAKVFVACVPCTSTVVPMVRTVE